MERQRRLVNGKWVEIPVDGNGVCTEEAVRESANIPIGRSLVLQVPGGSNRLLFPGERFFFPENFPITDVPAHKRGAFLRPSPVLLDHLEKLSYVCTVDEARDYSFIIVHEVNLPPGYNFNKISVLIEIPSEYPLFPPGIGNSKIYLPRGLLFNGRKLKDFHEDIVFENNMNWGWFCYQHINWDPNWDDLTTLLEMIRADLSDPKI